MRTAQRVSGNLLIAASAVGGVVLALALLAPEGTTPMSVSQVRMPSWMPGLPAALLHATTTGSGGTSLAQTTPAGSSVSTVRPITRIAIPAIDLAADVVQAELVEAEGGLMWQVPAFKVGHAEGTAGPGQAGNAVLLGHVTSVRSGNVFQDLDRVTVGDEVQVFSDADEFDYRVTSTSHVPRTDSNALQPTSSPTLSLITCTGVWLPTIWDYTERLVVSAELSQ